MVPTYNEAQKYKKSAVLFIFNIDLRIFERMDIQRIQNNIFLIRGHRVMLNFQLVWSGNEGAQTSGKSKQKSIHSGFYVSTFTGRI
jgi:hypothetical protein